MRNSDFAATVAIFVAVGACRPKSGGKNQKKKSKLNDIVVSSVREKRGLVLRFRGEFFPDNSEKNRSLITEGKLIYIMVFLTDSDTLRQDIHSFSFRFVRSARRIARVVFFFSKDYKILVTSKKHVA